MVITYILLFSFVVLKVAQYKYFAASKTYYHNRTISIEDDSQIAYVYLFGFDQLRFVHEESLS